MNHKTMLKLTPVAASLMMALGGVAHAAAPAANALPGAFLTNNSGVTYNIDTSTGTIANLSGNAVLQFGGSSSATVSAAVVPSLASTATAATAAGFNIGASAALQLNASATGANVLVSDLTGQASNIYGSLTANGSVASLFIANPNGVVVGGTGNISAGNVALVGYQADAASFAATSGGTVTVGVTPSTAATITTPSAAGGATATANGEVTISNGATVNAGYLLVAGAGQVNVGALNSASTVATLSVAAGSSVTAGSSATLGNAIVSASAVANLGGNTGSLAVANLGAAGAVNVLGSVDLSNATIGGTLTNNANLTLGSATNVAAFTNNANASVGATNVTFGGITNNANLDANSGLTFGGAFVNAGKATVGTLTANSSTASVSNAGTMSGAGIVTANTLASFTNTGTLYDGGAGVSITANTINLGGTVASGSSTATLGAVVLNAVTGDLVGSAALNLNSTAAVTLSAGKGNVNYTGSIAATGLDAKATTGAVALGAVNVGTAGAVVVNAGNGNITLGGNVSASTAGFTAAGGSVLVNKDITATTSATFNADNQIMVYGNVNAGTAGTVNLTTNKVWTGPYNLGVVIMPSGGVVAGTVATTVAGNMLQYGNISAANGFQFTGNSYYQGAGAAINTPAATFGYGNASSGGAIAGGIVFGSANPQPSNAFFNAVVVGGSNATGGVSLDVTPANLGTAMQNVNLMGIGNTTLATAPAVGALFGSTGSTVINTGFVPSNLFIRAQGGNLTLAKNSSGSFYWPGLVYASTVQTGTNATVDTTKVINVGAGAGMMSNALPYQATGGAGIYLMTGKVNVGDITVNTNSNVNVLNPLQVAGLNLYTASAPTGLVLNYSATLPTANVVSYTPPAN
jgi:filamentous hemagglutinin family protein